MDPAVEDARGLVLRRLSRGGKRGRSPRPPKEISQHSTSDRNRVFYDEMDEGIIQKCYMAYTKRLHDLERANGQMTMY